MKRKVILSILLVVLFTFISCTSAVRNKNDKNNNVRTGLLASKNNKTNKNNKFQNNAISGVKDTTYIYLSKNTSIPDAPISVSENNIDDIYTNALNKFNKEDYEIAAEEFKSFIEASKKKNAKYYQALFYYAESTRQNNSTAGAIDIINTFINDKNVPADVVQPSLVLLGQCYCDMNKNRKANEAFSRLKREFPDSKYIKIANCK